MENDLWLLTQLGAAQLFFRPDIPSHAAVQATVEVAREVNAERWTGFLNGTLRTLSRAFERTTDADAAHAASAIAGENADDWIRFDREVLTDKAEGKRISKRYSLPRWLVGRWTERLANADAVMRASNIDAGLWLRCRPDARDDVLAELAEHPSLSESGQTAEVRHTAEPGPLPESVFVEQSLPLMSLAAFREGRCSVQNITAMHAVDLLDPQPGERVLDLCAAPGGKTGMIAERIGSEGRVVAADSDAKRLPRIAENVSRLGLTNVDLLEVGREGEKMPPPASFDAALVDVPCSNTGVLAKRPEARWRISTDDLAELPPLQTALLSRAAVCVRPGGRLLYSTCSIEPEENADVVRAFLDAAPRWSLETDALTLPTAAADGGYRARLIHTN